MLKPSEKIAKEIQYRKDRMDESVKKISGINIDLIAEAFPQGYWQYGIFLEFEFCMPFAFHLIDDFKEFMKIQYPDCEFRREQRIVWESKDAGHFLYYDGFEVSFRTSREGTTCVLNKVGEETKVVPIYEVICADGAAEGSL